MKKIIGFLSIVIVFITQLLTVYAGSELMPNLETGRLGNLSIHCEVQNKDLSKTVIDGVEFTAYRIAGVSVENGVARYSLLDPFKESGVDFEQMTASESNDAAQKLALVVAENSIVGKSAISNQQGVAELHDMDLGMYLLVQTGSKGSAETYNKYSPFLAMVPLPESGKWIYDSEISPKIETQKKDSTPNNPPSEPVTTPKKPTTSNPVKTGDTTNIYKFVLLMLSAVAIILSVIRNHQKRDNEKNVE